jgi:hypothetical protein
MPGGDAGRLRPGGPCIKVDAGPLAALAEPADVLLGDEQAVDGLRVGDAVDVEAAGDRQVHALAEGAQRVHRHDELGVAVDVGGLAADDHVVVREAAAGGQREGGADRRRLLAAAHVLGADVAVGPHGVPRLAVAAALVAAGDGAADEQAGAAAHGSDALARDPGARAQAGLRPVGLHGGHVGRGQRGLLAVGRLDAREGGDGAEGEQGGDQGHGEGTYHRPQAAAPVDA